MEANIKRALYIFGVALIFSIGISFLFYPGFMSYDSFHALKSARNGVTDSMWPPMVSYIWRMVDIISSNPVAMLFGQIFLLFLSLAISVFYFTLRGWTVLIFFIPLLVIPSVLGTLAVIWKDVLMTSIAFSGFALMLFLPKIKSNFIFFLAAFQIFFLFFIATCVRHNAITATAPLLLYLVYLVVKRINNRKWIIYAGMLIIFSVALSLMYGGKIFIDNYSLPGLSKIPSTKEDFFRPVRMLDLAGASICSGESLFITSSPGLPLEEIQLLYQPKHVNLSNGLFERVKYPENVMQDWINAGIKHPICLLNNKYQLGFYLFGLNEGPQFLITHPSVDANEYGYELKRSELRDWVVSTIVQNSGYIFLKPWFLYVIWFVFFILAYVFVGVPTIISMLILSGFLYILGLIFMGNAADARLIFYPTIVFYFSFYVLLFKKTSMNK